MTILLVSAYLLRYGLDQICIKRFGTLGATPIGSRPDPAIRWQLDDIHVSAIITLNTLSENFDFRSKFPIDKAYWLMYNVDVNAFVTSLFSPARLRHGAGENFL